MTSNIITKLQAKPRCLSIHAQVSIFIFVLLLFLGTRLAHILTGFSVISDCEELFRGAIGRDIMLGPTVGFLDYQIDGYSGGSAVVGLLAAVSFKIFGPTAFALKLVPLFFSLLSFILLVSILRRYACICSALWGALFFIFAPPGFIIVSHYAMGFHSESIAFSLIQVWLTLYYLDRRTDIGLFFLGIVSGLGIWFTYIVGISTLVCIAIILIELSPRAIIRKIPLIFSSGFIIGFSPWIIFNLRHRAPGVLFLYQFLLHGGQQESLSLQVLGASALRFLRLWTFDFPATYIFQSGFFSIRLNPFVYQFLLICVLLMQIPERIKSSPLLLKISLCYLILFSLFYSVSIAWVDLWSPVGFRYFVPLYVFLILILSMPIPRWRLAAFTLRLGLLSFGILAQSSLLFQSPFGKALHYKGYSRLPINQYMSKTLFQDSMDHGVIFSAIRGFDGEDRSYDYRTLLYYLFEKRKSSIKDALDIFVDLPQPHRADFMNSLGWYAAKTLNESGSSQMISNSLALIPQSYRDVFSIGLTASLSSFDAFRKLSPEDVSSDMLRWYWFSIGLNMIRLPENVFDVNAMRLYHSEILTDTARRYFFRGLGAQAALNIVALDLNPKNALNLSGMRIPNIYRGDFDWGLGYGARQSFPVDMQRALDFIHDLEPLNFLNTRRGLMYYDMQFAPKQIHTLQDSLI